VRATAKLNRWNQGTTAVQQDIRINDRTCGRSFPLPNSFAPPLRECFCTLHCNLANRLVFRCPPMPTPTPFDFYGFQKASGPQQMTPTHFPTSHPAARTCSAIKSACHCLQSQSPAHKKSLNGNNKAGYGNKNADKVNISVVASKVEVSVLFPSFWRGFFTFKGEHLQCLRRK